MVIVKDLTSTQKMDKKLVEEAIHFYNFLNENGFSYLTEDDNGAQHAFIRRPVRHQYQNGDYYWDAVDAHEDALFISQHYDFGYAKQHKAVLIEDVLEELTNALEHDGAFYYV